MPGTEKMGEKVKTATNFASILRLSPIKVLSVSETAVSTVQTDQPQTTTIPMFSHLLGYPECTWR